VKDVEANTEKAEAQASQRAGIRPSIAGNSPTSTRQTANGEQIELTRETPITVRIASGIRLNTRSFEQTLISSQCHFRTETLSRSAKLSINRIAIKFNFFKSVALSLSLSLSSSSAHRKNADS
jgi:hypothetical protein